jgi:hypothetical protein
MTEFHEDWDKQHTSGDLASWYFVPDCCQQYQNSGQNIYEVITTLPFNIGLMTLQRGYNFQAIGI